jgi:hypothetical protein
VAGAEADGWHSGGSLVWKWRSLGAEAGRVVVVECGGNARRSSGGAGNSGQSRMAAEVVAHATR